MEELREILQKRLEVHQANIRELEQQKAELGPASTSRTAIALQLREEAAEAERISQIMADLQPRSAQWQSMDEMAKLRDELGRWQAVITLEVLDRTRREMAPLEISMEKINRSLEQLNNRLAAVETDLAMIKRKLDNGKPLARAELTTWAVVFGILLISAVVLTVRLMP